MRTLMKALTYSTVVLSVLVIEVGHLRAETVDMSKYTCQQLTGGPLEDAVQTAVWLSGFYNGRRNNTKIDLKKFQERADAVVTYCKANPSTTIMKAVKVVAPTIR
jgi:hypothetical protein